MSIQAQLLKNEPLSWFHSIASRISDNVGELKSSRAAEIFFALGDREKRLISSGLRKVRIHITDPRAYYKECKLALETILGPGEMVLGFLRRLDKQPHIRNIQSITRRYITTNIVRDSLAEQLRRENYVLECVAGCRLPYSMIPAEIQQMFPPKPWASVDISVFEKNGSNPINQASTAVAKSASVFSDALDVVSEAITLSPAQRRAMQARALLQSAASRPRAFDKGESQAIGFVREQQALVVKELSFPPLLVLSSCDLTEVDSRDFHEMQAADVAAGIARDLWFRFGLVSVIHHFEHVLLNGTRLTENCASCHPFAKPLV